MFNDTKDTTPIRRQFGGQSKLARKQSIETGDDKDLPKSGRPKITQDKKIDIVLMLHNLKYRPISHFCTFRLGYLENQSQLRDLDLGFGFSASETFGKIYSGFWDHNQAPISILMILMVMSKSTQKKNRPNTNNSFARELRTTNSAWDELERPYENERYMEREFTAADTK
ncbi:hypothetical protein NQ318_013036 [Aromia moschata]|uniref:Uncharacterized protein n=1 Tax=Aromia moschata TaxID=1265417 RepID=A0AAV8Y568_9CUCU|nr:hypothetical protein NQ318_013036 [Aromia moschata]